MKTSHIRIVTPGHQPVTVDGTPSIIVRDPSGMLIRLQQDNPETTPLTN